MILSIHVNLFKCFDIIILKGMVHPKMQILSSFTHSHVVPNPFIHLRNTNEDICKKSERILSLHWQLSKYHFKKLIKRS